MGHSSLAVSLTYLRLLEVSELGESDIPMVLVSEKTSTLKVSDVSS